MANLFNSFSICMLKRVLKVRVEEQNCRRKFRLLIEKLTSFGTLLGSFNSCNKTIYFF